MLIPESEVLQISITGVFPCLHAMMYVTGKEVVPVKCFLEYLKLDDVLSSDASQILW